jgi:hypothetical protein
MRKQVFGTALSDSTTTDVEGIGQTRIESDPVLGDRHYRWVRNGSGGSLAVNSLAGIELGLAAVTAGANTDATKIVRGSSVWVANAYNGYWVRVLDDAGAAGAAPEGEVAKIANNSTTILTLTAALSAAVTTTDTFQIFRPWHIIAAADAMVASEVAGVLMGTIADGSYGWVQFRGFNLNALVVAAGTTLAAGAGLKAGVGVLIAAADNADNGEVVGTSIFAVTTDTVLRTAPVYLSLGA